jgi:hypothetical protein
VQQNVYPTKRISIKIVSVLAPEFREEHLDILAQNKLTISGTVTVRYAMAQLVEALRYKLKCREFNSRWCYWNFSLT